MPKRQRRTIGERTVEEHRAVKQATYDNQMRRLALDGALLSASLVLSAAGDVLTPPQHRLVRKINNKAASGYRRRETHDDSE